MLNKHLRDARGSALVEAVFAIPLLVLIVLGTVDFGRMFYKAMAVTHASRVAAQYGASTNPYDNPAMQTRAQQAAASDIPSGFSASASHSCMCYVASETAMTCGTTCAGQYRVYVTVTGTATFNTVVTYPGIPSSTTISRTTRMRAQ